MRPTSSRDEPSNTEKSEPNWAGVFAYGLILSLFLLAITPLVSILI